MLGGVFTAFDSYACHSIDTWHLCYVYVSYCWSNTSLLTFLTHLSIYLFVSFRRYLGVPRLAQVCRGDGAPCVGPKEREQSLKVLRRLWVHRVGCDVLIQTENGESFPGRLLFTFIYLVISLEKWPLPMYCMCWVKLCLCSGANTKLMIILEQMHALFWNYCLNISFKSLH